MPANLTKPAADALLMHPEDNVLLAVTDLPAGHVTLAGGRPITLPSPIPSGHKLARQAVDAGGFS